MEYRKLSLSNGAGSDMTSPGKTEVLTIGGGIDRDVKGLIHRAVMGDKGSFSELVSGEWSRMIAISRSIVGSNNAEDIAQESLILAWRNLRKLKDPASFSAWLTRITVRTCLRYRRRFWNWLPFESESAVIDHSDNDVSCRIDIERCLALLTAPQRAALYFTEIEGKSDREIGIILGIRASSVRAHRRRARKRLVGLREKGLL